MEQKQSEASMLISDKMYFKTDCSKKRGRAFHNEKRVDPKRWYNNCKCICTLHAAAAKSLQSCPTLCDPIDGSPPGSSVHGILQARTLEWVAMPSSKGSSQPRDQTHIFYISLHWCSLPSELAGKPCGG